MFVLKRTDGWYVIVGRGASKTKNLQKATWFRKEESAQAERCLDERVVDIEHENTGGIR